MHGYVKVLREKLSEHRVDLLLPGTMPDYCVDARTFRCRASRGRLGTAALHTRRQQTTQSDVAIRNLSGIRGSRTASQNGSDIRPIQGNWRDWFYGSRSKCASSRFGFCWLKANRLPFGDTDWTSPLLLADLKPGLVFLWRHNPVHSHILDKLAIMIGDVPYRRDGKRTEPRNVRMFAGTLRRPDRRSPASHNRWFVQPDKQSR
jgi:hypothetical protein